MIFSTSLKRFVLLVTSLSAVSAVDDGGFGGMPGMDNNCPNYRCTSGLSPVQKSRSKFSSAGCGAMGGGVMMMGMGGMSGGQEVYSTCCDAWHACYQTCGSAKATCDATFSSCTKQMCLGDEKCNESANLNGMMVSMGGCQKFNDGQYQACDCVGKNQVEAKRSDAIRNFYRKFSPENVDKASNLAKKTDSAGKMASLFKKLLVKYPDAITKIEDPTAAMYRNMMNKNKDAKEDKKASSDDDSEDDSGDDDEDDDMDHTTMEL